MRAKTGTTDDASALSGYVGGRYAFAVVENGRPVGGDARRGARRTGSRSAARVGSR